MNCSLYEQCEICVYIYIKEHLRDRMYSLPVQMKRPSKSCSNWKLLEVTTGGLPNSFSLHRLPPAGATLLEGRTEAWAAEHFNIAVKKPIGHGEAMRSASGPAPPSPPHLRHLVPVQDPASLPPHPRRRHRKKTHPPPTHGRVRLDRP
jgi:hypothetical protein